jgi:hypothetical protein
MTALERFEEKYVIDSVTGCWMWTAYFDAGGYARLQVDGRCALAHKFSYETFVGPVPEGKELDHTCHKPPSNCKGGKTCIHRRCVNWGHLEPVTRRENVRRGVVTLATHCPEGHPYDEDNTILEPGRRCRICRNARRRRRRARKLHGTAAA